jgi:hypothetical protein
VGQFLLVSSNSLAWHLLLVTVVALTSGVLAGRYGDRAWGWLVHVLT